MYVREKTFGLALMIAVALTAPHASAAEGDQAAVPPLSAPDISKGEEKSQVCIACHGEKGISQQPNYPHLHGQHQTYLLRQMRTFRDGGDRRDPIMTPMLENMTDQDLVNLAAYYSSFDGVLGSHAEDSGSSAAVMPTPPTSAKPGAATSTPAQETAEAAPVAATPAVAPTEQSAVAPTEPAAAGDPSAGQAKSAACAACHGMDGRGTTPLFPNLQGQKAEYLARQLRAFRDGGRQDPTMAPMAMALTDQDIADLAAFYADLK